MALDIELDETIAVCYSYHKKDRSLLNRLDMHLDRLRRKGYITTWHVGLVEAGERVEQECAAHWEQAQIILLLVSLRYLADDQCYRQMELAAARAEQGLSHVVPVLVDTAKLEHTPLRQLQPLPKSGLPIAHWRQKNIALAEVADGIHSLVGSLLTQQYTVAPPDYVQSGTRRSRKILSDALPPYNHPTILKRERDIQEIYARVTEPDTSTVVLTGLGGIGKSTVAAQVSAYAEQQRLVGKGPFNGEPLWLHIRPHLTLRSLAMKIALALEQWSGDLEHLLPEELALKLLRSLNKDNGSRRLIVLDDFEAWLDGQEGKVLPQYAGVAEWLAMLNSSPCSCRILITTRILPRGNDQHRQMCMKEIQLQGLAKDEVQILLRLWEIQVTQKELERIFERSKGHLLALVFFDKLLRSRRISPATLLNDAVYQRLWVSDLAKNLFNHMHEQLDELPRSLLRAFAVYREAVPWRAVYGMIQNRQHITEEQFQKALGVLLALILLQGHASREEEYYELHPLVVEFFHSHVDQNNLPQEHIERCHAHAEAARYYQYRCFHQPGEKQWLGDDTHLWIEAVWHNCQAEQWQEGYALLRQGNLFSMLERSGEYVVLRELYTLFLVSEKWHPEAEAAARMYNELGEIHTRLGEKGKALSCFEKALEYATAIQAYTMSMKALNNLGSIYRSYGQSEKALSYYRDAMNLCAETSDPIEKGITLNNLGRALQDLGRSEPVSQKRRKYYQNALIYYKQALAFYREGGDEIESARTTNNLGETYSLLGKMKDASISYQQSLKIFQKYGEKRDEGVACSNLGTFYRKQECYADAFEYYVQALHIFQQIGTRLDEAIVLRNLGHVYVMIQRNDVALACFLLARDRYEEMHQPQQGTIGRGLQLILADGQPFDQAVAAIGKDAQSILEKAIAQHLEIP